MYILGNNRDPSDVQSIKFMGRRQVHQISLVCMTRVIPCKKGRYIALETQYPTEVLFPIHTIGSAAQAQSVLTGVM